MHIEVEHETRYQFDEPATYSIQRLHLHPVIFEGQNVIDWTIAVEPAGVMTEGPDVFGNMVHVYARDFPHDGVTIRARGVVETTYTDAIIRGAPEPLHPRMFLRTTALTEPDEALIALAADARKGSGETLDLAHRLMNAVRDAIDYEKGQTEITSTAADALALGKGVCQDHAHAFVCCARLCGIPARYVGGYMWDDDGSAAMEAGHGWAEAHVEGVGWIGFDVANRACPTDAYVRVAIGFDYMDASPVRGMRRSGGGESLDVEVRIEHSEKRAQAQ